MIELEDYREAKMKEKNHHRFRQKGILMKGNKNIDLNLNN